VAFRITADIEGERQLDAYLGTVATGIKDFREPLNAIGSELLKTFDLNFQRRGALAGGWARRKDDNPWPLLEKTGAMRSAFRSRTNSDSVTLDNTAPYFRYHQSNQPRTRLPRRVMMFIDEQRRQFIIKRFQRHIVESVRGGR
jgi:hypothetical protein